MTEKIELESGWILSAPPGVSREALEFIAEELNDQYIRSVADTVFEVEFRNGQVVNTTPAPHLINPEWLVRLVSRATDSIKAQALAEHLFRGDSRGNGTVVYQTTNPGPPSEIKDRYLEAPVRGSLERAQYEGNWTVHVGPDDEINQWGHIAVAQADGSLRHLPVVPPELPAIVTRWIRERQWTTPGWTGSVTGPPRPAPTPTGATWNPARGVIGPDGRKHKLSGPSKRGNLIVEPGADSNPDARLMEYRHGRLVDVGPAFPHGLGRPYTGNPRPLPWDHPWADPLADLRAAGGGTYYGEHRDE